MQEEQLLNPKYFNTGGKRKRKKKKKITHPIQKMESFEGIWSLPAGSETHVLLIHFRAFWIYFFATHTNSNC